MAFLPNSGIETHPAGTGLLNAIVNGNWAAIDNWINPAYSFNASRAGTTVTATAGPAADGKIFTSEHVGAKIRFANGTEATIASTAGTPSSPSATCVVGTSGTVASQAFNLFAAVTESPFTLFARAFTKSIQAAQIPNGYTLIWSAAAQRFVASPLVAAEPSTFLNTNVAVISNSSAQASIVGRASGAVIPANTVVNGTVLEFVLHGKIKTTSALPAITFNAYLGGTKYAEGIESGAGQVTDADLLIMGFLKLTGSLATMAVAGRAVAHISTGPFSSKVSQIAILPIAGAAIDMTSNKTFDFKAQFGTAHANNVITIESFRLKQYTNAN